MSPHHFVASLLGLVSCLFRPAYRCLPFRCRTSLWPSYRRPLLASLDSRSASRTFGSFVINAAAQTDMATASPDFGPLVVPAPTRFRPTPDRISVSCAASLAGAQRLMHTPYRRSRTDHLIAADRFPYIRDTLSTSSGLCVSLPEAPWLWLRSWLRHVTTATWIPGTASRHRLPVN
jgi:hypothetical protein